MRLCCFKCFKDFILEDEPMCLNCGWRVCPHCGACLCTLPDNCKAVAIAVWASQLEGEERNEAIKLAKTYAGVK